MASYSSDFIMEKNLTVEELIMHWSCCIYHNHYTRRINESYYDIIIQRNGIVVFDNRSTGNSYAGAGTYDQGLLCYFENEELGYEDHEWEEAEKQKEIIAHEITNILKQAKAAADNENLKVVARRKEEVRIESERQLAEKRKIFQNLKNELGET